MHTDQTNSNIAIDIGLSPIKVIYKVFEEYIEKKSLTGFHALEYNLQ